jgi:3-phosphoshikimate 1-carboxyvinyltransferase
MQYLIRNIPAELNSEIPLPSSKSISNRLLVISALSSGKIKVANVSDSDDTKTMLRLLNSKDEVKDAGHAGTTMRFLTAYYSQSEEEVIMTGTERMKNRPIGELVKSLQALGAEIEYLEKEAFPLLKIRGRKLKGGHLKIDSGISSQYISAILMIAPLFDAGLQLELTGDTISSSYIDMTIALMKESGAEVSKQGNQIRVSSRPYGKAEIEVEPDWSSASYWFMMAGLHPKSNILLKGLKNQSYQGDAQITAMFDNLGVSSEFTTEGLRLRHSEVKMSTFRYDFRENPDMVQSFVPYCIARDISFYFSGCRSLRIKETDRVAALYNELLKFGVEISFSEDGDLIWWDAKTKPDWNRKVLIETYKDHRMALGFAPLAIKSGEITINDPEVVSKSYPGFWEDLRKVGISAE